MRSMGLSEIAKWCGTVFEVGLTSEELWEVYGWVGWCWDDRGTAFGLGERDLFLGQYKVRFSIIFFWLLEINPGG